MDITPFINSKDIAGELDFILREEDAENLPVKYAWLVWQSKYASLKEKHDAWQKIIDTMPDYSLPLRRGDYEGSLHVFLKEYMEYERSLIEALQSDDNDAVYAYTLRYSDERLHHCERNDSPIYRTLSECLAALQEGYSDDESLERVDIAKRWLNDKEKRIDAAISPRRWKLMNIHGTAFECPSSFRTFDWMWFDFPTFFRRGDILAASDGVPFVLDRICTWTPLDSRWESYNEPAKCKPSMKHIKRWEEYGDTTDMHCHGYFVSDNGRIYLDHHPENYMDMEYYRGELTGYQRILKALSSYIKDEISLDILLNAYHIICAEEAAAGDRKYLDVSDKWMKLAGLIQGGVPYTQDTPRNC